MEKKSRQLQIHPRKKSHVGGGNNSQNMNMHAIDACLCMYHNIHKIIWEIFLPRTSGSFKKSQKIGSRGLDTLSTVKRGLVDPGAHQPELSQEPENAGIVGIVLQVRNRCEGVRVMLKELVLTTLEQWHYFCW